MAIKPYEKWMGPLSDGSKCTFITQSKCSGRIFNQILTIEGVSFVRNPMDRIGENFPETCWGFF